MYTAWSFRLLVVVAVTSNWADWVTAQQDFFTPLDLFPLNAPVPPAVDAALNRRRRRCIQSNFCLTWVCQQNVNRERRVWGAFGSDQVAFCDSQQGTGRVVTTGDCTVNGVTATIGAFARADTCEPGPRAVLANQMTAQTGVNIPVGGTQTVNVMFAPPPVYARGQANQIFNANVERESELYLQQNPGTCGTGPDGQPIGLEDPTCRETVKNIVTAPGYVPIGPPFPSFVDTLTVEFLKAGVYTTPFWANQAAQNVVNFGNRIIADGDPHLKAFTGDTLVFDGRDGGIYALFSDPHHQVNTLFRQYNISGETSPTSSTWIEAVGIRYSTALNVEIHVDVPDMLSLPRYQGVDGAWHMAPPSDKSYLRLIVNGEDWTDKIRTDASVDVMVREDDDARLYMPSATKEGEENDGAVLIITMPGLEVTVDLETEGVLHLDVQMKLLDLADNIGVPSGVLGETLFWAVPGTAKALAGEAEHYEVQGLLDINCALCASVNRTAAL